MRDNIILTAKVYRDSEVVDIRVNLMMGRYIMQVLYNT